MILLGHPGRNNFDRLGHILCGALSFPFLEYLQKVDTRHYIFNGLLTFLAISGIAALYEEFEWAVIQITEAQTGLTYVGMQGDEWDAQADMFCCSFGALTGIVLYYSKDFFDRVMRSILRKVN